MRQLESIADMRARLAQVRHDDIASFRANWRTVVCMAAVDFLSYATVGFLVGSVVGAWALTSVIAEVARLVAA